MSSLDAAQFAAHAADGGADIDGDPGSAEERHGLLRFATAGSVDDGKSTLVGRLLHDSKSVLADQLDAVERTSQARGLATADLSLLVDGLRAEREQGITIDVAYRYFATPRRSFILADTPGHEQYTRNTVTGASTADLVVILVDARTGVVSQTRRHAAVAALVGVPHLLLAVNKIDLVDFDEDVFDRIAAEFDVYCRELGIGEVTAIPISALHGDNVVTRSERIRWYTGPSVLEHLETVSLDGDPAAEDAGGPAGAQPAADPAGLRFPVQYVIRPRTADLPDYRGYAGRIAAGTVRAGDRVVVLPSGRDTKVTGIDTADGSLPEAGAGDSVVLLLADDVDIARGDLIAGVHDAPPPVTEFTATVAHLADKPLRPGLRALLRYGTTAAPVLVSAIEHRLDIDTLATDAAADALRLNDIGQVRFRLAAPLPVEDFRPGGTVGALLVVDPSDGTTLAAGMAGDRRSALRPRPGGVVQKDGTVTVTPVVVPAARDEDRCPGDRPAAERAAGPANHRGPLTDPDTLSTPGP
ncbi:sulfate adenylyltransferase subunit 1 [Nakamurella endophytica]